MDIQTQQIIAIGKHLYEKDLTVATSGNISIKTDKGIYITVSGSTLGNLTENDVVIIDENGHELTEGKASSEKILHAEIYKTRPDVNAIIHTHPVYLTSFAVCHTPLKEPIMSENILYFEDIPVAPYAMPSSLKLVENTVKCLKDRDVALMANHGAIAVADTIEKAFLKMETAEYYAKVTINAKIIGTPQNLTSQDVKDLLALKASM